MGGVGKTALAVVVAHHLKQHCPDGQLYFDLRGADAELRTPLTPTEVMRDVILALHPSAGQLPAEGEALARLYRSVLAQAGRVLLLFDNAADEKQLRSLLPPENCILLVTSRPRIDLPGVPVRDLDCLPLEDAAVLLLKLAPAIGPNAAKAAELCGRLPLALEVFAGAVARRIEPVLKLLTRLQTGLQKLSKVDAAFAVSESLLSEETRQHWHLLAIFTASFDLQAAAAIWDTEAEPAREIMQSLVDTSLVEYHDNTRFRLHDLARRFCQSRLGGQTEEQARLRHFGHYIRVATAADELYLRGNEHILEGLSLFDRERPHLDACFTWLADRQDEVSAKLLIALVNAATYVRLLRDLPSERITWLEVQRAAAQRAGDLAAESAALGNLGNACTALGDARKAIEFYEENIELARKLGDRRGEGGALGNLGIAHMMLGNFRKAIELYERSLIFSRETNNRRAEANALGNLGSAYATLGDARKAIDLLEQNLVIEREIGDRHAESQSLGNLGIAHATLGDAHKAIELYEQRLIIAREIGDRDGEASTLGNLGIAYAQLGDAPKAVELLEQQLAIVRKIGDRRGEGIALGNLGIASKALGDLPKAIELYEQRLDIAREIGDRLGEGIALGNLANVYSILGDARKAAELYDQRLAIAREIGDRRGQGTASFNLATLLWEQGQFARALKLMEEASEVRSAIEDPNAEQTRQTLANWRAKMDGGAP